MIALTSELEQRYWGLSQSGAARSVPSLLSDFLVGLSDNTKRKYKGGIERWHAWLFEHRDYFNQALRDPQVGAGVAVSAVRQWVADMIAENLSANSIRLYFTACDQFYGYCKRGGFIDLNPFEAANVRLPSVAQGVRQYVAYSLEETAAIFAACRDARERALMAVSFGAGLRREEVARLMPDDYYQLPDVDGKQVHVLRLQQTKNRNAHEVALPAWAAEELQAWLDVRGDRPGRTIWVYESTTWVYETWRRVIERAGVRYSPPHAGRATAITQLILQGAELHQVAQVANHKSMRTTERYFKKVWGPSQQVSRGMQDLRGGRPQCQQPRLQAERPSAQPLRPAQPPTE